MSAQYPVDTSTFAPKVDAILTGDPQVNGNSFAVFDPTGNTPWFAVDDSGIYSFLPLIEKMQIINNGSPTVIDPGVGLVQYKRADAQAVVMPVIGSADVPSGRRILIASTIATALVIGASGSNHFYDNGVVSSVTIAAKEAVLFIEFPNEWRVVARYSTLINAAVQAALDLKAPLTGIGQQISLGLACSDMTTAITAGTNKAYFPAPFNGTLDEVFIASNTAPTGSGQIFNVKKAGVTMLSTKVTIDVGGFSSLTAAVPPVISVSAFNKGQFISVDFDQVGSTIAGLGIVAMFKLTRTS